jgi:hypothetical protein
VRISDRDDLIDAGMRPMTDDVDATPATPDPDDHVARLRPQIDAATARRAGYWSMDRSSSPSSVRTPYGIRSQRHQRQQLFPS